MQAQRPTTGKLTTSRFRSRGATWRARTTAVLTGIALLFALVPGQAVLAQGTGVDWKNVSKPTKEEFETIKKAIGVLTAALTHKPGKLCPKKDEDGGYTEKKGNKMPLKDGTTDQLPFPDGANSDKKHKVAPRPDPGPAPPGTPPGPDAGPSTGTSGGKYPLKPADTTWEKLLECLAKLDVLEVGDPPEGENVGGQGGSDGDGKNTKITLSRKQLKDAKASGGSLLFLATLLMHEVLHTKQQAPAGGGTAGGAEPPAYTAQRLILCWIEDFLEKIVSGDADIENPDVKKALDDLSHGHVFDADLTPAEQAAKLLEILGPHIKRWKTTTLVFTTDNVNGGNDRNNGDGKNGIYLPFGDLNWIEIDTPENPLVLRMIATGPAAELIDLSLTLPLEAVEWADFWRPDSETSVLLIAGQAGGVPQLLVYQDLDGDDLPESLVEILMTSDLSADSLRVVNTDAGSSHALLLRNDEAVVQILADADHDGYPESLAVEPFAFDPTLSQAVGFSGLVTELGTVYLDLPQPDGPGPWLQERIRLVDVDLDGVADSFEQADDVALGVTPLVPPDLREADYSDPATLPDLLVPGSDRLTVFSVLPGDVLQVRNLSAGGAELGLAATSYPQAWATVDLAEPLAAGSFLEVRSLLTGMSSISAVPATPIVRGNPRADVTWDANADGIDDLLMMASAPGRLLVGRGDGAGLVVATEEYVLPFSVGGAPLPSTEDASLGFTANLEGWDPGEGRNRFEPALDARGFSIAQPVGDLDGDGRPGDRFAMVVGEGGSVTAYTSLDGAPWQESVSVPDAWAPVEGYLLDDVDRDGDLDLEICPDDGGEDPACRLYVWTGEGFFLAGVVEEVPFFEGLR